MDAPAVVRTKELVLREILALIEGVDHIRGRGLLLAIELKPDALAGRAAAEIARACLDKGLILNAVTPTALRIAPPYIATDEQMNEAVATIAAVLESS